MIGKMARIDKEFEKELRKSALKRIQNNVDDQIRGTREMTKMMLNTKSINEVLKELQTTPRMEDIKKFIR